MLFHSYLFLLLFLPLAAIGWRLLCAHGAPRAAMLFLTALSLWFYAANDPRGLAVLLVSALINFQLGRRLTARPSRAVLALGLAFDLGVLGVCKYLNFTLENVALLFGRAFTPLDLLVPLGVSFFTFQQVAYLVDAYRGQAAPYRLTEYLLFVSFFPYVMSGPIAFHSEIIPQLRQAAVQPVSWEGYARSLCLIARGLAKKVLLADTLGSAVGAGWDMLHTMNATTALCVMLAYSLQLYFDFSGYCDVADGAAGLLGVTLPRNFDSPYRACSIASFWKRWHMTMTRFFTRYLYIPLGGSRGGLARTCRNTMIVFLVSGLWHGANWTFLVWGGLHGAALVCAKLRDARTARRLPRPLGWLLTFLFVNLAWIFFRAPSLSDAMVFLSRILTGGFGPLAPTVASTFLVTEAKVVCSLLGLDSQRFALWMAALVLSGATALCLAPQNARTRCLEQPLRLGTPQLLLTAGLLVWSILSFTGVSTFLYFNF